MFALMMPLFLDVRGRACLVVGGGTVAERKVRALLEEAARLTVVAPRATAGLRALARAGRIRWERRGYRSPEAGGYVIVIAAARDRAVNEQAARDARATERLVNVADAPELCDWFAPAVVKRGALRIAVSTSGACPALAKKLRKEIEELCPEAYGRLVERLGRFREEIRAEGEKRRQTGKRGKRKGEAEERSIRGEAARKRLMTEVVESAAAAAFLRGEEGPLEELLGSFTTEALSTRRREGQGKRENGKKGREDGRQRSL